MTGYNSFYLHITAMILMLLDHSWNSLFPQLRILTTLGRMAYPIFAFMIVEGYFNTKNIKKYLLRLFIFALLSEIPFDLFTSGMIFDPFHQNVLFTFIISLSGMMIMDKIKERFKPLISIILCTLTVLVSSVLSTVLFTDYFMFGVMMVYVFYFLRGKKWWVLLLQILFLYMINDGLGGYCVIYNIFGIEIEIVEQTVAVFALIPVWLYNGQKGYDKKWFRYFCYAFYPVHMLILYFIGLLLH